MFKRKIIIQILIVSIIQFTMGATTLGALINMTGAEQQVGGGIGYSVGESDYLLEEQFDPDPNPQGLGSANLSVSFTNSGVSLSDSLTTVFSEDQVTGNGSAFASAVWGSQPTSADDVHGGGGSIFKLYFTRESAPAYFQVNGQIVIDIEGYSDLYPEDTFVYVKLSSDDVGGMVTIWEESANGTSGDSSTPFNRREWLETGKTYLFEAYSEAGTMASADHTGSKSRTASFSFTSVIVQQVDIDQIWFKTEKNYSAGSPETDPYDIGALVFGSNLNSVKVTSPADVTEYLEEGPGYWYWDREEKFDSLDHLYVKFPTGNYVFMFNEGQPNEDSAIVNVNPDHPTGYAEITNPDDGATDVPLDPTFTWNSCSTCGDILFVGVGDIMADEDIYMEELDIGQTSWTPGLLPEGRLCDFGVSVENRNDVSGTTANGDTFNFRDVGQWSNGITFTTVSSDIDIEWIGMTSCQQFRDGEPQGDNPWSLDIWVRVADPGSLDHIDITKPDDSVPFVTLYEEDGSGWWDCSLEDNYSSLTALRDIYPEGIYKCDFRNSEDTLIKSLNIEYNGLPGEPAAPVNFTYPLTEGQTGISADPTFTWEIDSEAADASMTALENDEVFYFNAPVPISSTSWTPGPLLHGHEYELDVSVMNIKDWAGGPGFPTMTDSTGDTFSYSYMIEYLHEITFTTLMVDIVPDRITTRAKTITCNIWPPSGYDVTQIDLENIRLEYPGHSIPPDRISVRRKQQMLVVKFPVSGLSLEPGPHEFTITCNIIDGPSFGGTDSVEVVQKGGKQK